ncbi:killer cell lectin-like receptor subfamily B member 1B allele B isoform X2 [Polypterus senegalus]|uniref:killer cell lectin-like receptor subfamily B member 1B allele B isoform X2 n=1 Tax=Polypterus senegalus TaxID=55291 RepID=UPI001966BF27|nr:killer cell lectin-like receptor subfamily B member 1B allele B isoform X2 [Polypterus senegalus]
MSVQITYAEVNVKRDGKEREKTRNSPASPKITKSSSRCSTFLCTMMIFLLLLVMILIIIVVWKTVHKNIPQSSQDGICNNSKETDEVTSNHDNLFQNFNKTYQNFLCNKHVDLPVYKDHLKKICISEGKIAGTNCTLCPVEWLQHLKKCYFISKENKTWHNSRNFCNSYLAHLVKIENDDELEFLRSKMVKAEYTYWIGLWQQYTYDIWRWFDGTPMDTQKSPFKIVSSLGNRHACISQKHIITGMPERKRMWICERDAVPV